MTDRERYQRAFSSLHASADFAERMESMMDKKKKRFRPAWIAACAAIVMAVGGSSVYAADLGGIQRLIQVWIHGEMTEVTLITDGEDGTYTIRDAEGREVEGGGGVAIDEEGNSRPLTETELEDYLVNAVTTDRVDGRLYLLYKDQKMDLTGRFEDSDYCYVTLVDGDKKIYATVTKNGGVASSDKRYLLPHEFSTE